MTIAPFRYFRPRAADEAVRLLREYGPEAKLLAGGQSLIPMMKLGFLAPRALIDIAGIDTLAMMTPDGSRLRIGALVRHAAVASSTLVRSYVPALCDAAALIGDPQVRNHGSIGGSAAHADPAADYPAVLLALDAQLAVMSVDGERSIGADEFFCGLYETALDEDELLTAITVKTSRTSAYVKLEHPASGYAVVGAGVSLELEGSTISSARLGITGVADIAFRPRATEQRLTGLDLNDAAGLRRAVKNVADRMDVREDTYAGADYRAAMADVIALRAVLLARSR